MTWSDVRLERYRRVVKPGAVLFLLTALALWRVDANVADLASGITKGVSIFRLFLPPAWSAFPSMIQPALVTVLLALTATPIGAACALAFGLAAARNVAPPWLRASARTAMAFERGLPEIVILLILVAAFGLGPFAGIIALVIGSVGMLGKLVGDAIEEIDPGTVDSVACVGATHAQMIRFVVLPEILPALLANMMFRFEVNIRASVLLGAVGAGGIGYELTLAMNQLEYGKATVAAFISFVLVFVSERASNLIRSRVLAGDRLA